MFILARYISIKFINVLVFAIISFLAIFIIVDLIENLDRFINNQFPARAVIEYYIYYVPFILILIMPVAVLLAALFSVGGLARHNEIIAMKAAGISLYRIFTPVLLISFLISLFALFIANRMVPLGTEKQAKINEQYLKNRPARRRLNNVYLRDDQNRRISMRYFNAQTNVGNVVSIRTLEGTSLKKRIDARRIAWEDSVWTLYEGFERSFTDLDEHAESFDQKQFVDTSMRPDNITRLLKNPEEMSYRELKDFIEEVKRNGGDPNRWIVDLYLKIAMPFANLIIVLFGLPLSSSQTRRSSAAKGFGISLVVTFVYFGILKTTQSLGHNGKLEPIAAAWLANLIFGIAGLGVLFKAQK